MGAGPYRRLSDRSPEAEREHRRAEAERERAEATLTFDALIEEWAALHLAQRRERFRAEAVRAIRHAGPETRVHRWEQLQDRSPLFLSP
jgi:hypothetical protein